KNMLACCSCRLNGGQMKFWRGSNYDRVDVLLLEQSFRGAIRVLNFKITGQLLCRLLVHIGHCYQLRPRNEGSQVLRVAPSHPAHTNDADAQFGFAHNISTYKRLDYNSAVR